MDRTWANPQMIKDWIDFWKEADSEEVIQEVITCLTDAASSLQRTDPDRSSTEVVGLLLGTAELLQRVL